MSIRTTGVNRGQLAGRAVGAGIIGGILIDLFLALSKSAPFPGVYQFVASGLVGKTAFTSSSYIALGVAMHFVISIVWALIYAFTANAADKLEAWLAGGIVFGIVVMIVMTIVQTLAHLAGAPTVQTIIMGLIAHIVFFGLPIAWFLSQRAAMRV